MLSTLPSAIPGSPTTQTLQTSTLPAQLGSTLTSQTLVQSLAQLPIPSFLAPSGYTGRIVFPGTGLNIRAATGDGPLTQPPGVFQVGGAGETQAPEPRPTSPPPVLPLPAPRAPGTALLDADAEEGMALPPHSSVLDNQETVSVL
jgi:hypothetical protein